MADGSINLPEKYNLLDKFFNSLDSSILTASVKGIYANIITNISPKIEYLTDRRFTYNHLAQLKFILPEAIEVKKVLTHDEQTSCMKPDLHVSLNANALEDDGKLRSESVNSWLRKVFWSRLLHFSVAHPEGDEVPRGTLPHPFNQLKQDTHKNKIKATKSSLACEISSDALLEQQPAAAAGHLSQSFRWHFSQQGLNQEAVNTTQMPSIVSLRSSVLPVSDPYFDECSSRKEISAAATPFFPKSSSKQIADEEWIKPGASATCLPPSHTATTPVKKIDSTMTEDYLPMGTVSIEGTPAKLISTPAKLMSVTPGLQPPKRCCMSPDDDSTRSPNILARRPPRNRSLKFDTPVKSASLRMKSMIVEVYR
ncbi:unnamed protein product [Ilex paraguariensis]|uniref:CDT1 Geminin-binding domain-containing protein n=1 Tax=Ilex paraguariensis TaxID=185542 RepID=A0ABC8RYG7_9AQUA